jgi:hypothetical protein
MPLSSNLTGMQAIEIAHKNFWPAGGARRKMHRPAVNERTASIINCSFECPESAKIAENFVENGL